MNEQMKTQMNQAINALVHALIDCQMKSKDAVLYHKVDHRLSDIKRARTYLEKAFATLTWAQHRAGITPEPVRQPCVYCGNPDCPTPQDCPVRRQHMAEDAS